MPITTLLVTEDNNFIISGSKDRTVRVWNVLEKRQEGVMQEHYRPITCLALTDDNKFIVSGSKDNRVIK